MAIVRQGVTVADCPYCHRQHTMTVEVALRPISEGEATRARMQVLSICKATGGDFLASVEFPVPAGRVLRRARAVTLANGAAASVP